MQSARPYCAAMCIGAAPYCARARCQHWQGTAPRSASLYAYILRLPCSGPRRVAPAHRRTQRGRTSLRCRLASNCPARAQRQTAGALSLNVAHRARSKHVRETPCSRRRRAVPKHRCTPRDRSPPQRTSGSRYSVANTVSDAHRRGAQGTLTAPARFTSAPCRASVSMHSTWPLSAATNIGVAPTCVVTIRSAHHTHHQRPE